MDEQSLSRRQLLGFGALLALGGCRVLDEQENFATNLSEAYDQQANQVHYFRNGNAQEIVKHHPELVSSYRRVVDDLLSHPETRGADLIQRDSCFRVYHGVFDTSPMSVSSPHGTFSLVSEVFQEAVLNPLTFDDQPYSFRLPLRIVPTLKDLLTFPRGSTVLTFDNTSFPSVLCTLKDEKGFSSNTLLVDLSLEAKKLADTVYDKIKINNGKVLHPLVIYLGIHLESLEKTHDFVSAFSSDSPPSFRETFSSRDFYMALDGNTLAQYTYRRSGDLNLSYLGKASDSLLRLSVLRPPAVITLESLLDRGQGSLRIGSEKE